MRTYATKTKATQQTTTAKSTTPGRAHFGQSPDMHSILQLQGTIGNQTVQRLLQAKAEQLETRAATTASTRFTHDLTRIPLHTNVHGAIQPILKIGNPEDKYEQEADRTAEQVTRLPEQVVRSGEQKGGSNRTIEQPFERKPAMEGSVPISPGPDPQTQYAHSTQALSSQERAFFEPRFGHDFSRVRIHANARSAEMADAMNAHAFTVGRDIYFGAGMQQARTAESQGILAHELAHVRQQARMGPVLQPKLKITGKASHLSRVVTLLNSGLLGSEVSIDKSGNVTIKANSAVGTPSAEQTAAANRLKKVINDSKDVIISVSAGSKTLIGSYKTGDIDITDIETIGLRALIHEIEEQYQKQVKGIAYGSETTGAHGEGFKAESEVVGAKRGPQKFISSKTNADGTIDAVVEIPWTYPDGKVKTNVLTIKKNNVESSTWK